MKNINCPCCGKTLERLEPYIRGSAYYWCDNCKADIDVEFDEDHKLVTEAYGLLVDARDGRISEAIAIDEAIGYLGMYLDDGFTCEKKRSQRMQIFFMQILCY